MSALIVDLVSPGGTVYEKTEIPDDLTVREIVWQVIDHLRSNQGRELGQVEDCCLRTAGSAVNLDGGKTLVECGVKPGDTLVLFCYENTEPTRITPDSAPPAWKPKLNENEVQVFLSVMYEATVAIALDADLEVSDLITYLREKFQLPPVKHMLQSMALGRFLLPSETLRTAGVPNRDKLTLGLEELAGGAPPAMRDLKDLLKDDNLGRPPEVPPEIERFLEKLEEWALINRRAARIDSIKFWSLKIPAIIGASCTGVIATIHLMPLIPALLGMLSAIFVTLDGLVRPGALHNVHTRAFHDIRGLEMSVVHQCAIGRLEGKDGQRLAAKVLGDAEKKRMAIAAYLRDVEADAYTAKHPGIRNR